MPTKKNNSKSLKISNKLLSQAHELGKRGFDNNIHAAYYDQTFMDLMNAKCGTDLSINHMERVKLMDAWMNGHTSARMDLYIDLEVTRA